MRGMGLACHQTLTAALAHPGPCCPPSPPPSLAAQLSRAERYRDLLSIEVVHTLNAATCEYHLRNCPPSEQLVRLCTVANAAYEETVQELRQLDAEMACTDSNEVGREERVRVVATRMVGSGARLAFGC